MIAMETAHKSQQCVLQLDLRVGSVPHTLLVITDYTP